jgi:acyl carrier protein
MTTVSRLKDIIRAALQLGDRAATMTAESRLLGAIPEFDSMAVVTVLTMVEDEFGISIADDDVSADAFETLGTLAAFVDGKAAS